MQEEVTGKSVALIIDGAKMSEQVLEKALQKFLEAQKNKSPKIRRGKQTLKQLAGQNAGLANIEISDKNIKAFTSCSCIPSISCPRRSGWRPVRTFPQRYSPSGTVSRQRFPPWG